MSAVAARPVAERAAPAVPVPSRRSLAAVVRRGVRDHRRAPLTWGGSIGAMSGLMAAIWPSIEDSMDELIRNYPSGLKEAFGIDTLDTVERYVDAEMLSLIVPLALAVFAVRCISRMTVGAEERGHLDTLLSLPLSRRVLAAGSFIATGIVLAAVLAVIWAITWIAGVVAGTDISAVILGRGVANVWPLAMVFAGLALLIAGLLRSPAVVVGAASGVLVAMYVIDLVGKLSEPLEPVRGASVFRYYGSAIQDGLDVSHVLGLCAVAVLLAAAGIARFDRRDIG
jgi:beta-exotoxin I transport system permease protein